MKLPDAKRLRTEDSYYSKWKKYSTKLKGLLETSEMGFFELKMEWRSIFVSYPKKEEWRVLELLKDLEIRLRGAPITVGAYPLSRDDVGGIICPLNIEDLETFLECGECKEVYWYRGNNISFRCTHGEEYCQECGSPTFGERLCFSCLGARCSECEGPLKAFDRKECGECRKEHIFYH